MATDNSSKHNSSRGNEKVRPAPDPSPSILNAKIAADGATLGKELLLQMKALDRNTSPEERVATINAFIEDSDALRSVVDYRPSFRVLVLILATHCSLNTRKHREMITKDELQAYNEEQKKAWEVEKQLLMQIIQNADIDTALTSWEKDS